MNSARSGVVSLAGMMRRWKFYIAGVVSWTAIEAVLFVSEPRTDFIEDSKLIGTIGIGITVVYLVIILSAMIVTRPKSTLDRRFIWHLTSVMVLFLYALGIYIFPDLYGTARPRSDYDPSKRLVIASMVWFQIWGFVMWSALAVLISMWRERGRFIWDGFTRKLRPVIIKQPE